MLTHVDRHLVSLWHEMVSRGRRGLREVGFRRHSMLMGSWPRNAHVPTTCNGVRLGCGWDTTGILDSRGWWLWCKQRKGSRRLPGVFPPMSRSGVEKKNAIPLTSSRPFCESFAWSEQRARCLGHCHCCSSMLQYKHGRTELRWTIATMTFDKPSTPASVAPHRPGYRWGRNPPRLPQLQLRASGHPVKGSLPNHGQHRR